MGTYPIERRNQYGGAAQNAENRGQQGFRQICETQLRDLGHHRAPSAHEPRTLQNQDIPSARPRRQGILHSNRQFPPRPVAQRVAAAERILQCSGGRHLHLHLAHRHSICAQCHILGIDAGADSKDVPRPLGRRGRRRRQKPQRIAAHSDYIRAFPQKLPFLLQ